MKASNFASKIWVSIKLPDSPWQQHDDHLCCDDVREPCILLKRWLFCLARMLKSSEGTRYMKICWLLLLTHSISAAQNLTPATGVERKSQSCSALKVLAVICAHNQDENSNQKHDMSYKLLSRQGLNHTTKLPCHPTSQSFLNCCTFVCICNLEVLCNVQTLGRVLEARWFGQMYPVIKLCFTLL